MRQAGRLSCLPPNLCVASYTPEKGLLYRQTPPGRGHDSNEDDMFVLLVQSLLLAGTH